MIPSRFLQVSSNRSALALLLRSVLPSWGYSLQRSHVPHASSDTASTALADAKPLSKKHPAAGWSAGRCWNPERLQKRSRRVLSLDSAVSLHARSFVCSTEQCLCTAVIHPAARSWAGSCLSLCCPSCAAPAPSQWRPNTPAFVSAALGGDAQVQWRVVFGRGLMVGSPEPRAAGSCIVCWL